MNITFQTVAGQRTNNEQILGGMEADNKLKTGEGRSILRTKDAFAVDFESSSYSNDVYGNVGKDLDDITNMAQNTDVLNRHNYMALLSNTLSEEDYAKALKDGFDIKDLNSADAVTIVDKIKSVLLQSGKEIVGYNDDLSLDKLEKITGSKSFANALQKSFTENDIPITSENVKEAKTAYEEVSHIEALDDSAVKYLVQNKKQPTIENIYRAQHSTNGQNAQGRGFYAQETEGYYAQKSDDYNWKQLEPQMEKVIDEAGFKTDDECAMETAKWSIQQGIPLTCENLKAAYDIKNYKFPISEQEGAEIISAAIADGKRAVEGNILKTESNLSIAMEVKENVDNVTDDAIKDVVLSGKELNLRNLFISTAVNVPVYDEKIVANARLQLEEVRLQMTVEANKQLLDSGFSIDTAPMEELIEKLKAQVGEVVDEVTGVNTSRSTSTLRASIAGISVISRGPVDVVGATLYSSTTITLGKISETSSNMAAKFKAAGEGYEQLMTAPRSDLGDNIQKAFRNVDNILEDLNQEVTDENRRAIRILGYNKMEINEDNFESVRAWDLKLKSTIDRLKPGAVLDLIRDGKNPLGMTIDELSESLDNNMFGRDDNESGSGRKSDEKYAKFLYKLEHKAEITQEEKTSFIGIYRLFHTLKATDYSAIGSLLKTGQEMTIGNLLSATRTQSASKKGIDYVVDDEFGGLDIRENSMGLKIDEQINSAFIFYKAHADIVYENLEPEKLLKAAPKNETLLPDLSRSLENAGIDEKLEREYSRAELEQIRETANSKAVEGTLEEMDSVEIELTYNNLEAMISNRRDRRTGNIWEKSSQYSKEIAHDQEEMVSLLDEEGYEDSYKKQLDSITDKLWETLMNPEDNYIDVRAISLMKKQISVMKQNSEKGSYEIPVEVDGNKVSMHVTLRSDDTMFTRMEASVQTYEFGLITATLYEENGIIGGMLTTTSGENADETEYLEGVKNKLCDKLAEKIKDMGVDQNRISILYHAIKQPTKVGTVNAMAMEGKQESITDTNTLLKMAKAFIEAL